MTARVTVGLCIKNSGKRVEIALDSISRQDFPHGALKLIIVDENEDGGALPFLMAFSKKTDIKTVMFLVKNKGLGASRQIVVDNADGEYIVWVDDDFVLKTDFISKQVEFIEKSPSLAAAMGNESPIRTTFLSLFEVYLMEVGKLNTENIPMGGFEIFRRKAIDQVGGYDINIKGASEDQDIAIRIKNLGWTFGVNNSAGYYRKYRPDTWKALWRKNFWYGYGRHFLYHKFNNQKTRWELFFPLAFWSGLQYSFKHYKFNREKTVFLLAPFYFFMNAAGFVGFFIANANGYGHRKKVKGADISKSYVPKYGLQF